MIQRTEEWFQARCGKITGSRIGDVMTKGGGATRRNYAAELVIERITHTPTEHFQSPAMRWGTETEPEARSVFEMLRGVSVTEVGFINHPEIAMSGASPDGLIGDDGCVEFKCPNTRTHIDFYRSGTVPKNYLYQCQWVMECTQRQWCYYVSYDPRCAEAGLDMKMVIVARDDNLLTVIRNEVRKLDHDIEAEVAELMSLRP